MRAYFFNNMYLNGIHNGIQAGHAIEQMWGSYVEVLLQGCLDGRDRLAFDVLREFSKNHQTFILLNGGDHNQLGKISQHFGRLDNPYPYHRFAEPGLNDAYTSVVIIVPERLYDRDANYIGQCLQHGPLDEDGDDNNSDMEFDRRSPSKVGAKFTEWELEFLKRRMACGMAK